MRGRVVLGVMVIGGFLTFFCIVKPIQKKNVYLMERLQSLRQENSALLDKIQQEVRDKKEHDAYLDAHPLLTIYLNKPSNILDLQMQLFLLTRGLSLKGLAIDYDKPVQNNQWVQSVLRISFRAKLHEVLKFIQHIDEWQQTVFVRYISLKKDGEGVQCVLRLEVLYRVE